MVECQICGKELKKITWTHLDKHDMSLERYKEMYPETELYSKEVKRKMSESAKGHTVSKETRKKIGEANSKKTCSKETRQRISATLKKYYMENPNPFKNETHSKETRKQISENRKGRMKGENNPMKDPEIAKKALKNANTPTSIEKQFMEICNNHNLPYKYVGDGEFWIENMNPDFIECNGKKIVIEILGDYWHDKDEFQERKKKFSEYGWKCIGIWGHELKELSEEEIVKKIK